MNTKLIEYIENIVCLERKKYEQQKILNDFQKKINQYSDIPYEKEDTVKKSGQLLGEYFDSFEAAGWVFVTGIKLIVACMIGILIFEILGSKTWANIMNIIANINKNIEIKYNNVVQRYRSEYKEVKKSYDSTVACLNRYYDLNIIYPKYRNFALMSSMLDYFKAGICTELTGHEGAYRILEDDIRFRRIEYKMDIIIKKLDEIKEMQGCLYSQIAEANRNVYRLENNINTSVKKILNNQSYQNEQLSSISYNSNSQSQDIKFIRDMELYRFLSRR